MHQAEMESTTVEKQAINPDWLWSVASNIHVAKDRDWFVKYQPIEATLSQTGSDVTHQVVGMGDVNISVIRHPDRKGKKARATLRLRDVLHVPSSPYNILGEGSVAGSFGMVNDITETPGYAGEIVDNKGTRLALFESHNNIWRLAVHDAPQGFTLGPSNSWVENDYSISLQITDAERVKLDEARPAPPTTEAPAEEEALPETEAKTEVDPAAKPDATTKQETSEVSPYTADEKRWIKRHYNNEFKFLKTHGLRMFKASDRAEGRVILRALMAKDGNAVVKEDKPAEAPQSTGGAVVVAEEVKVNDKALSTGAFAPLEKLGPIDWSQEMADVNKQAEEALAAGGAKVITEEQLSGVPNKKKTKKSKSKSKKGKKTEKQVTSQEDTVEPAEAIQEPSLAEHAEQIKVQDAPKSFDTGALLQNPIEDVHNDTQAASNVQSAEVTTFQKLKSSGKKKKNKKNKNKAAQALQAEDAAYLSTSETVLPEAEAVTTKRLPTAVATNLDDDELSNEEMGFVAKRWGTVERFMSVMWLDARIPTDKKAFKTVVQTLVANQTTTGW